MNPRRYYISPRIDHLLPARTSLTPAEKAALEPSTTAPAFPPPPPSSTTLTSSTPDQGARILRPDPFGTDPERSRGTTSSIPASLPPCVPASSLSSASSTSSISSLRPQCLHRTSDGRRCRMFRSPAHPEFCDHHSQQELRALDRDPILPLAAEILGPLKDLRSAAAINAVISNAFVLLADGRLDPRRAALLTYMAQVQMQTLKKLSWESIDSSPTPNLEQALRATLRASVSKSEAQKLIRRLYGAALTDGGPSTLSLK